jgi:UBX domain-containing protein 1/4
MASDLDQLVDMGFDKEKSELALQKSGNLTSAIDWLDKNADKSIDDIKEEQAAAAGDAADAAAGTQPMSMVCNECGKKLRNMAAVQFHAEKSGHEDFSESTEELAPLTEDEKKAKLEELRAKLAEKRAKQSEEDKAANKRNEEIRKKHTKENDDAKEELQRKEQIKEAQKKRQEKLDDLAAKKRIKEKIEADKAERKRKAEEEKAKRANPAAFNNPRAPTAGSNGSGLAAALQQPTTAKDYKEARLRFEIAPGRNITKTFPVTMTLFEVAHALQEDEGMEVNQFTFLRKKFERSDFGQTLEEAQMVPSAALRLN